MYSTHILLSVFFLVLSAAALAPASEDSPLSEYPSPVEQAVKRGLLSLPQDHNTTNQPLTPSSPLNTTNDAIRPVCYLPDSRSPNIHPTDCHTALYTLLVDPSTMTPQRWNRLSNLPVERAFRTCSVILARSSATADAVFQPVLIAHAAALVVQSCVTARYGFQGGFTNIGQGGAFVVYVSAYGAVGGTTA